MITKVFIVLLILCFLCGLICVVINLTKLNFPIPETKVVYKYMPKTFEQEQYEQPFVSEIFKTLFTDNTPWVNSVMDYDARKLENVNNYFISQI